MSVSSNNCHLLSSTILLPYLHRLLFLLFSRCSSRAHRHYPTTLLLISFFLLVRIRLPKIASGILGTMLLMTVSCGYYVEHEYIKQTCFRASKFVCSYRLDIANPWALVYKTPDGVHLSGVGSMTRFHRR